MTGRPQVERRLVDREPILVVEDSPTQAVALATLLEEAGHKVMIAGTGEAALDTLRKTLVQLVLTDIVMPGIDGWELLQRLRTRRETAFIPVIICSVINDPELAFALGASHYVSKPVTREALRLALQQLRV